MVKKIRTTCIIRELRNCGRWQANSVYRPVKHDGRLLGVFLTHRPKMGVSDYRYTLDLSNFLKLGRNVDKKILDLFILFLIHLCPVVEVFRPEYDETNLKETNANVAYKEIRTFLKSGHRVL